MAEAEVGPNPPKGRASPKVLDSKTFKDGAIYLYRRADYKKPTWFIRLKIPGAKGYIWKTSKTTDEHAAYRRYEPQQSRLSIKYKILLAQRLIPIFQGKTFEELDTSLISKMVTELNRQSKKEKLSPNTIKRVFADFRQFLVWFVEEGYSSRMDAQKLACQSRRA
jgi:integrase